MGPVTIYLINLNVKFSYRNMILSFCFFIMIQLHALGQNKEMNSDTLIVLQLHNNSKAFLAQGLVDSALSTLEQAIQKGMQLNYHAGVDDAVRTQFDIHSRLGNEMLTLKALKKGIDYFNQNKYYKGLSHCMRHMGVFFHNKGMLEKALQFSEYGLQLSDSLSAPDRYLGLLNNKGGYLMEQGDFDNGMNHLMRALTIADLLKDTLRSNLISQNIALQFLHTDNSEVAIKQLKKTIEVQTRYQSSALYVSYASLGYLYHTIENNDDSAMYYYMKALPMAEEVNDIQNLAIIYLNLSQVYFEQKKYDSTSYYLNKGLTLSKQINDEARLAAGYQLQGLNYTKLGENTGNKNYYAKAIENLKEASAYAANGNNLELLKDLNLTYSEAYAGIGDYKNAYTYRMLHDSMRYHHMSGDIAKKIAEIDAKYQTEKKETEIKRLTAEQQLSDEKLLRQKTFNYALAAIIGLLLVSSIAIVRSIHKKRMAEKRVAALEKQNAIENMRSKIASDVHDDMGANLTRLGLNAEKLIAVASSEKEKGLAEKISIQSKEVITGMREIIWASNPAYDNLKSLLGFMRQYIDRFFDGTDIRPVVNFPHNIGDVNLHPEVRRNLFLILKESLNNATKYADTDKIDIDFSNTDEHFQFKIKDYGKGMDHGQQSEFSNGLNNMKKRAEQIRSVFNVITAPGQGLQILVEGHLY